MWFSILHTKRLLTFPGTCHLNLKQLNCNSLNIFVMNRDWSLSFQEFLKRWGFITINQSKACFMQMSFFAIAASIVEHPYHWTVAKLCCKKWIHYLLVFWKTHIWSNPLKCTHLAIDFSAQILDLTVKSQLGLGLNT